MNLMRNAHYALHWISLSIASARKGLHHRCMYACVFMGGKHGCGRISIILNL